MHHHSFAHSKLAGSTPRRRGWPWQWNRCNTEMVQILMEIGSTKYFRMKSPWIILSYNVIEDIHEICKILLDWPFPNTSVPLLGFHPVGRYDRILVPSALVGCNYHSIITYTGFRDIALDQIFFDNTKTISECQRIVSVKLVPSVRPQSQGFQDLVLPWNLKT